MMGYKLILFLITISTFLGCKADHKSEETKPNVLFLFADDMTYSAVRALGNHEIHTPNLDRMVQQGTTFTHAYNMGGWNGAICVASRAMIISGRSIWKAREYQQNWVRKDTSTYAHTWGQLMENAGYDTYMSGKWHVNAPADTIFGQAKNIRPGMPGHKWRHQEVLDGLEEVKRGVIRNGKRLTVDDVLPLGYNRPLSINDTLWSPSDTLQGGFWEGGKHWSEVVRDDFLAFLNKAQNSTNPFFMYMAFNAPHDHRQSPQSYIDLYPLDSISVPASFAPEHPYKESIGNERTLRDEALAPYPRTEYAIKVHLQEYYAIISHLDAQIGLMLDALDASGMAENTLVIFTADHGLSVGRHGLLGKQSMYDHSIRVPFIMRGPNVPKNKRIVQDIYLQDAMATALDIAKVEKPSYIEFQSLLPILNGSSTSVLKGSGVYGAYRDLQRMIRKDGYKLIVYPEADRMMLFDMENDPEEIHNLVDEEEQQERVKEMMNSLLKLQEAMDDPLEIEISG